MPAVLCLMSTEPSPSHIVLLDCSTLVDETFDRRSGFYSSMPRMSGAKPSVDGAVPTPEGSTRLTYRELSDLLDETSNAELLTEINDKVARELVKCVARGDGEPDALTLKLSGD